MRSWVGRWCPLERWGPASPRRDVLPSVAERQGLAVTRRNMRLWGLLMVEPLGSISRLTFLLHVLLGKAISWPGTLAPGRPGSISFIDLPRTFLTPSHAASISLGTQRKVLVPLGPRPLGPLLAPGGLPSVFPSQDHWSGLSFLPDILSGLSLAPERQVSPGRASSRLGLGCLTSCPHQPLVTYGAGDLQGDASREWRHQGWRAGMGTGLPGPSSSPSSLSDPGGGPRELQS